MMHLKVIRFSGIKKVMVFFMIALMSVLLIKGLGMTDNIRSFASLKESVVFQEDISRLIINSAVPLLDISVNGESDNRLSQFSQINIYSMLERFTTIDVQNPKTYLASQIPLLGLFEVNVLSGSVGGILSSGENINQANTAVNIANRSLEQPKPVENIKIDNTKPKVIIYHTHTTESYISTPVNSYEMMGDHRTTDRNFNVIRVGEEIKKYIETYYGISVYHDMTLHDYPSYEGSYNKSKPTVENLLKQFPDVQYIIDVHRDAFTDDETARKVMVTEVMDEQASKVMFVVGKSNPHWQENYYMALKLNQKIEEISPGLSKGILAKDRSIYNQDISNKSLLIEIGSDCNTLEESLLSAKIVGRALGELLKENQ